MLRKHFHPELGPRPLLEALTCEEGIPGLAHLQAALEGFEVQGEEYPFKDIGHTSGEKSVKLTGSHVDVTFKLVLGMSGLETK